ncbi:MAG: preprotein translocase subunit SecG [Spirochaetia bacterium]|nr:preprotein translocase subunit SecG [Spirochaetia bacterium]
MELFYNIVWVIHFVNVILLIAIVLLQTGKGSEVGFAFGGGTAQTMFGTSGGKNVLTKVTIALAVLFMTTSIILALFQARRGGYSGVVNNIKTEAPAVPGQAGDNVPAPAEVPVK